MRTTSKNFPGMIMLMKDRVRFTTWIAVVPYGWGPDEVSHIALVQFIAERHRLPASGEIFEAEELTHLRSLSRKDQISRKQEGRPEFSETQMGQPNVPRLLMAPAR